jgi:hypothetical protein
MSNSIRPYLIEAVDPQHLLDQVQREIQARHDMAACPTFVSNEGKLCQWMLPVAGVYEYRLVRANDLSTLQMQVVEFTGIGFDFLFGVVTWNDMYLQWMQRMSCLDDIKARVKDVFQKLNSEDFTIAPRTDELQLVEDVRSYLHLAPMGEDGQLVTIPFPVSIS